MLDSDFVYGSAWNAVLLLWLALAPPTSAGQPSSGALSCEGRVHPPQLDFEFRFFSGYQVSIPTRELVGPERPVIARLRVTPIEPAGAEPVELTTKGTLPRIPERTRGDVFIDGSFAVGPGRYRVEWLMVDSFDSGCSLEWEIEAKLSKRDSNVKLQLEAGEVADSRLALFRPERTRIDPSLGRPLRLKVLLNLDVWGRRRASVRLFEFFPRLAALRAISRHPRIDEVALTAFSVDEQRVYLRHGLQERFDFPGLRSAIDEISPAIVSIEQLGKDKSRDFLTELLLAELPSDEEVDAYVFLGPDPQFAGKADKDGLAAIGPLAAPALYLNFARAPWKGLIGSAAKAVGGKQIRYRDPRELAEALAELVERADAAAGR